MFARTGIAVAVAACVALGGGAATMRTPSALISGGPAGSSAATGSYVAPLPRLEVLRAFSAPQTPYGPGHLGVDLRAGPGEPVGAAGPGVVQFAGPVAGRGVVVVAHPDGVRTEYEPVRPLVLVGSHVRAGEPIGVLAGRHTGCAAACLHWGARRAEVYLDPLALLRPLGPVVLLPDPGHPG